MKFINDADAEKLKKMFSGFDSEIKFIFFTQENDCETCQIANDLLSDVASLSDKISMTIYDFHNDKEQVDKYKIDKVPALAIEGSKDHGIRFYGVPSGYEFNSLLNAIISIEKGKSQLPGVICEDLDKIENDIHLQVFVTPNCPHCPNAVKTAHNFALYSDKIKADMIEISEFPDLAQKYQVMSVPKVMINEGADFVGSLSDREFLDRILDLNK